MGFFSKILGGNDSQTIVRCDEAEFLIWKYQGGAVKSGTSIIVKDGEVAALIDSTQTTIEGPANTTASEDLSEVFFINLAGSNVVRLPFHTLALTTHVIQISMYLWLYVVLSISI